MSWDRARATQTPIGMRVGAAVLAVLVVVGVVAITKELDGPLVLAPGGAVVAALVLRWLVDRTRGSNVAWRGGVVAVVSAMVVALFTLVGVDVALGKVFGRLPPWLGILIGVVVIGAAAWLFVEAWPDPWIERPALLASGIAVLLLILLPPAAAYVAGQIRGDGSFLSPEGNTGSTLEVVVLRDGGGAAPPHETTSRGWAVTTWVGDVARDGTVRWGAAGAPAPLPAADADRVLLLEPHGTPARWLAVADTITPTATPAFALLDPSDPSLAAWRAALGSGGHAGRAVATRVPAPAELPARAVALAQVSPSAEEDLALAARHRPALFFDSREPYPFAYDVDALIGSGEMRICPPGQSFARVLCSQVTRADQLHRDAGRLTFDPKRLAAIRDHTTMYVHVVKTASPARTYLDYWWYFPYNPAHTGDGAMCGAGLDIAGMTCFDHQSDWEGVTVELDSDRPDGDPVAVLYAQHNGVRRYTWEALQDLWRRHAAEQATTVGDARRPLVFPARGTHASYPFPCRPPAGEEKCRTREVPTVSRSQRITDNGFDGHTAWKGNADACLPGCLTPFPSRHEGRDPASWNAFAGHWGTADCVLGVVCSESDPPEGPSRQRRYRMPWCSGREIDYGASAWRFTAGGACSDRPPPGQPAQGSLVALGDSFSSGQGGGDYDKGTTGHGNTCYRSRNAWPRLAAQAMGLTMTGILACSGAVSDEVILDGHSHNREAERDRSQIGRITGDPRMITLTIGGNDLGFAGVVRDCVLGNCATSAERRRIAAKLDTLKSKLPGVYTAVKRAAPKARLVVVDYPRLLPQGSASEERDNCGVDGVGRITVDEVEFLNARTVELDAVIADAARAAGADFVEAIDAFAGHELRCGQNVPFVNPARERSELLPASFHPTAAGYVQLADVVVRHIARR